MGITRRTLVRDGVATAALAVLPTIASARESLSVRIDVARETGPLAHIWEEAACSDRAAITLRESFRRDLDRWRGEAGIKRVRFHGVFNDELGVFAPSTMNRNKIETPNWQNVDRVYDGLVARGVAPIVELSFMPQKLASGASAFGFYKGLTSAPTSFEAWGQFVRQFTAHLVERYGLTTVRSWPFEVWNEPNLPFFWSGTQAQYFELYKTSALAVKSVDEQMQVGGPATSAASWIPEFLDYCATSNAPCDFITTHVYASDDQKKLFGPDTKMPQADVIPTALARVRQQIDASPLRGKPLWLTEWSSDSPAVIAHVVAGCLPNAQAMAHWTLSAAYEELGVADFLLKEGDAGYGAMVEQIAKPAFNTYKLLHALGARRLQAEGPVLASRGDGRSVSALVWNLAAVQAPSGIPGIARERTVTGEAKTMTVTFDNARPGQRVRIRFVDQVRGSPMPAWRRMGSPRYPTLEQIGALRKAAEIPAATAARLDSQRTLSFELPPEGIALIEFA